MKIKVLFLFVSCLFLLNGCGEVSSVEKFDLDSSVRPGDSLYEYVNNKWLADNPIPAEYSRWMSIDILTDQTRKNLLGIFEAAAVDPKNENEELIGKFYASAMDEKAIEELGRAAIQDDIDRIEAIDDLSDVWQEMILQSSLMFDPFFYIDAWSDFSDSDMNLAVIWQGGLGLPEKDYYFDSDKADIREKYLSHIEKMFVLAGFSLEESAEKARAVFEVETALAKASRSAEEERDVIKNFNKMEVGELQKLSPNLDWQLYFQEIGVADLKELSVAQPEYLEEIDRLLVNMPISDLKNYLLWNWLNSSAAYLSDDFVNENFDFYGKTLNGSKQLQERYKRVGSFMDSYLAEAVGQIYVKEFFPPQAKESALELVKNLRSAMRIHLENVEWMGEGTKVRALEKLDKMAVKIGYPDKWRDYSELELGENYFENVLLLMGNEFDYRMQRQGKPVDRAEWWIAPQTVNAYYDSTFNEIVFPAAILQAPYFDYKADDALNYGGIGMVIGHEITHGFDDQGRKFDGDGNLMDWLTQEDIVAFEQQSERLVEQFNEYQIESGEHVNGRLTLGENIADLGGIRVAYTAFRMTNPDDDEVIENMTPNQRFFASLARIWRINITPEKSLLFIEVDPHSPGRLRVDGALSNVPEFFEAFGVKEGDKMYREEEDRVVIW